MTTTITIRDATLYHGIITVLCALGSLLSVTMCSILLMHIIYHLKNGQTNNSKSNRMVIAYLITAIIACSIYGFIRSNIFTNITVSNFTVYQCAIGYFSGFFMAGTNRICLYFLFLHRIKSVFEGSAFEYKRKTFRIITMIIIVTYTLIIVIAIWMFSQNTDFDLHYEHHTGFIWCGHHSDSNGYLKWILIGWYSFILISEFTVNITFLLMFIKGLHGLQNSIVNTHKSLKNILDLEEDDTICDDDDKPKKMNKLSVNRDTFPARRGSMGFHEMMVKYNKQNSISGQKPKMNASIEMMVKLHHLTKKTTILVSIAIISSLIYWILCALNGWYSILVSWDIMINAICGWLMLRSSMKYWLYCAKYGCCRCCYKKLDNQLL